MTDPQLLEQLIYERPTLRPTRGTWIKHILLLGVTFCTATIAGSLFPFGRFQTFPDADPQTGAEILQFILSIPVRYAGVVSSAAANLYLHPAELIYGVTFACSLLFILTCHEMVHYIAC